MLTPRQTRVKEKELSLNTTIYNRFRSHGNDDFSAWRSHYTLQHCLLLQPDFVLIVSEWHANTAIINGGKRSVLVKDDSRWGRKPWHVAVLQPIIPFSSQHSSGTIRSRCKDSIRHIVGGSLRLAPTPSLLPPCSLIVVMSLRGQHGTDALEKSTGLTCDDDNLNKKRRLKYFQKPESHEACGLL